jgi:hypothetical protein
MVLVSAASKANSLLSLHPGEFFLMLSLELGTVMLLRATAGIPHSPYQEAGKV